METTILKRRVLLTAGLALFAAAFAADNPVFAQQKMKVAASTPCRRAAVGVAHPQGIERGEERR
jgi:hypothetical protein